MKYSVSPAVKFSYPIIKGSPKHRQELVSQYNEQIFNRIYDSMENGSIHVENIKRIINEVLPEKKRIQIISYNPSNKTLEGASDYVYKGDTHEIIGQTLEIPMKRCKMGIKTLVTFMHELTHVLDVLVNPKVTGQTNRMYKKELFTKQYDRILENKIYNAEKFTNDAEKSAIIEERRKDIKKILNGHSAEDKVEYLKDMRDVLTTEDNAYREQLKYAQILKSRGVEVEETDLIDERGPFMFKEKLDLIKEMGFEVIKKERKAFAKKLDKQA